MSDQKGIGWMYEGVKAEAHREDYLLGKTVDKNFEKYSDAVIAQKEDAIDSLAKTRVVGISSGNSSAKISSLPLNITRTEDPLVAIKVKEESKRRDVLENPLTKLRFQKMLKDMMEKKSKKSKKEKKRKREHSSSSDDSGEDEKRKKKSRKEKKHKKDKEISDHEDHHAKERKRTIRESSCEPSTRRRDDRRNEKSRREGENRKSERRRSEERERRKDRSEERRRGRGSSEDEYKKRRRRDSSGDEKRRRKESSEDDRRKRRDSNEDDVRKRRDSSGDRGRKRRDSSDDHRRKRKESSGDDRRKRRDSSHEDKSLRKDEKDKKRDYDSHIPAHLRPGSSSESEEEKNEDFDREEKAAKAKWEGYGLVGGKKKEKVEEDADTKNPYTLKRLPKYTVHEKSERKRPLTEEEKAAKLREMESNAKWRDDLRTTNQCRTQLEDEKEEKEADAGRPASFVKPLLNSVADECSMEDRLKQRKKQLQRGHGYMDRL